MTMLSWVVESSVRLTLLAGVAAAALWALRVTSAETQLRVWTGVVVASILLPFLPDQWIVPITIGSMEPAATSTLLAGSGAPSGSGDAGLLSRLDVWSLLFVVYMLGAAALLARLVLGWSWARRLTTEATPVSGQAFFESSLVHVPVTAGLLHPRIIVPHTWREWPVDMLTAVRAHEHAHATRRDGLWLTAALLHRALHWFNPLSWWLARQVASLSERASDDAALSEGVAPTRYAEILLSFATAVSTRHRRVAWIVAMARPSGRDTERRLDRVLTWKGRAEMNRSRLVVLAFVLLSGSAAVYTAGTAPVSVNEAATVPQASPSKAAPISTWEAAPLEQRQEDTTKAERRAARKPAPKPATDGEQKSAPVVVAPVALKRVDPKYTPEAMRAKIQGMVTLLVTIDAKGVVTGASVAESLDAEHGLDNSAIDAVMRWSFQPGTIDGVAKTFSVKVSMEFRLHDVIDDRKSEIGNRLSTIANR